MDKKYEKELKALAKKIYKKMSIRKTRLFILLKMFPRILAGGKI